MRGNEKKNETKKNILKNSIFREYRVGRGIFLAEMAGQGEGKTGPEEAATQESDAATAITASGAILREKLSSAIRGIFCENSKLLRKNLGLHDDIDDEDQAGQSSKRKRDDDGRASENEHLPGEMEKLRKINSQLEKRLEARDEEVQSLRAHITAFQARIDVLVVYEGQILDRRKRRQEATEANSVDLTGCDGEEAGAATGAPRH